jgi:hypothetical protein
MQWTEYLQTQEISGAQNGGWQKGSVTGDLLISVSGSMWPLILDKRKLQMAYSPLLLLLSVGNTWFSLEGLHKVYTNAHTIWHTLQNYEQEVRHEKRRIYSTEQYSKEQKHENVLIWNIKNVAYEIISCFPSYDADRIDKDMSNNFSIVPCVIIAVAYQQ